MLAFVTVYDIKISWLAKHSLFFPPLGWFLRALGGIPVVRNTNSNVVADMVLAFESGGDLALAEGELLGYDYPKGPGDFTEGLADQ